MSTPGENRGIDEKTRENGRKNKEQRRREARRGEDVIAKQRGKKGKVEKSGSKDAQMQQEKGVLSCKKRGDDVVVEKTVKKATGENKMTWDAVRAGSCTSLFRTEKRSGQRERRMKRER